MLDHADRSNGFSALSAGPHAWDWAALGREALAVTRRILRDEGLAQDAAQEALVRAWRHAARCADPARPGAWLGVIARREALRIVARPGAVPSPEPAAGDAGAPPDAEALDVRAAVAARLSELDRRLVHQRYWLGLTDREIAARHGLPVGTVKIRLHRARGTLRGALGEDAPGRA